MTAYDTIRERYFTENKSSANPSINIEDYPEVQTWLRTVSSSTGRSYLRALKTFCEWCGKTPKELILQRDKEKNDPDPNKRNGIRNLILDFRKHLEEKGRAPKTINTMDGAIRGFFTAVLGREGMVNVGNYPNGLMTTRKDLVPTLDELKQMIDVSDISTKFSIIFLAQTGMRPEDTLKLTVGDLQRELDLEKCPLAITFLPEKDRNKNIGERITFLGKDGIDILKLYLDWRKRNGETITPESPLFIARSKKYNGKSIERLSQRNLNERIKEAARKAGIGNSNGKYGRMRAYCLRKFFTTQLTNHGVEDKIVNFFTCHTLSPVDLAYWSRRVDVLREIYQQREKYLNPISGTQSRPSPEEIDQKIDEKLRGFIQSDFKKICYEIVQQVLNENNNEHYKSVTVTTEDEIIKLSNKGYDCQQIGPGKWLMRRKINSISTPSHVK